MEEGGWRGHVAGALVCLGCGGVGQKENGETRGGGDWDGNRGGGRRGEKGRITRWGGAGHEEAQVGVGGDNGPASICSTSCVAITKARNGVGIEAIKPKFQPFLVRDNSLLLLVTRMEGRDSCGGLIMLSNTKISVHQWYEDDQTLFSTPFFCVGDNRLLLLVVCREGIYVAVLVYQGE